MSWWEIVRPTKQRLIFSLIVVFAGLIFLIIDLGNCFEFFDIGGHKGFCLFLAPLEFVTYLPFLLAMRLDRGLNTSWSAIQALIVAAYVIEVYLLASVLNAIYSRIKTKKK